MACAKLVQKFFMTSSHHIKDLFGTCSQFFTNLSQFVQVLFIWALLLYDLFTIFSWLVYNLFVSCSKHVENFSPFFFTTYSWLVLELLRTSPQLFSTCWQLFNIFFMTCSWINHFFHVLTMTLSQLAHNSWYYLIMISSDLVHELVHGFFTTCSRLVKDLFRPFSQLVCNLFLNCS